MSALPTDDAPTPEQVAATAPDEYDDIVPLGEPDLDDVDRPVLAPPDPEAEAMLPLSKIRRYKQLKELAATAEAEFKGYKEEAVKLEAELVEAFSEAGMQNINVDGKTVYLHRSVYAKRCEGVGADDVKVALRAAGAGDLVTETVNANTLSAYVRELTEDDDAPGLPEPLVGVLEPGERFSIRINAAGSRPKSKTRSK